MNLVSYLLLPVRHLMYAQTPKAWLDASEKMQSAGTSIASTEVRDLLKVTWFKSPISWEKRAHSSHFGDGSSWDQSNPCCIPILARTREAAANPPGSKIWAIWLNIALLVKVIFLGRFTLNRSTSSAWFQTVPSTFSCVVPCNNFILGFSSLAIETGLRHPLTSLDLHLSLTLHPAQSSVAWLAVQCKLNHKCHPCRDCPSIIEQFRDTNFLLDQQFFSEWSAP